MSCGLLEAACVIPNTITPSRHHATTPPDCLTAVASDFQMDDIEAMFNQLVRDIDGLSQVSRAQRQEKLQTDHRP